MCFRNLRPSPAPSDAPRRMPGMSARMISSYPIERTPRFGTFVVKGYAPISGRARVNTLRSVDFPAFGSPTNPMSAMRLSSIRTRADEPGSPGWAYRGACRVELLNQTLPRPPFPPVRKSHRSVLAKSQSSSPVSASRTMVPGGTCMTTDSPSRPCLRRFCPGFPSSARRAYGSRDEQAFSDSPVLRR